MISILATIAPVFVLIGIGYLAVRTGYLKDGLADHLNAFAVKLAVPLLLFRAMAGLDFAQAFSLPALISFYAGAFSCFALGIVIARSIFKRSPGEAVAVGFAGTFSNSVLIGIAIVERSFGTDALTSVFGIIAFHAPLLYIVGTVTMEMMRRDGQSLGQTMRTAGKTLATNSLMVGILAGVLFNLSGLTMPEFIMAPVNMLASAAIPVALVGIGAALIRYKLTAAMPETLTVAAISLFVHPAIVFTLAHYVFGLETLTVEAIVTIAAMPPGVNIYIFAVMYDRAVGLAASALLVSTALSVVTVSLWLYALQHVAF